MNARTRVPSASGLDLSCLSRWMDIAGFEFGWMARDLLQHQRTLNRRAMGMVNVLEMVSSILRLHLPLFGNFEWNR